MEDILAISRSEMNFAGFEAAEALCGSDTFMLRKAKSQNNWPFQHSTVSVTFLCKFDILTSSRPGHTAHRRGW